MELVRFKPRVLDQMRAVAWDARLHRHRCSPTEKLSQRLDSQQRIGQEAITDGFLAHRERCLDCLAPPPAAHRRTVRRPPGEGWCVQWAKQVRRRASGRCVGTETPAIEAAAAQVGCALMVEAGQCLAGVSGQGNSRGVSCKRDEARQ